MYAQHFSYNQFGSSKACYGIGTSPYGPFKNMGVFAEAPKGAQSHPGIITYKGKWYYFYHRGDYTLNNIDGSLYKRNICIDYLSYDENDLINKIKYTKQGVAEVK